MWPPSAIAQSTGLKGPKKNASRLERAHHLSVGASLLVSRIREINAKGEAMLAASDAERQED